jgi:hypothetical protein
LKSQPQLANSSPQHNVEIEALAKDATAKKGETLKRMTGVTPVIL